MFDKQTCKISEGSYCMCQPKDNPDCERLRAYRNNGGAAPIPQYEHPD